MIDLYDLRRIPEQIDNIGMPRPEIIDGDMYLTPFPKEALQSLHLLIGAGLLLRHLKYHAVHVFSVSAV